LTSQDQLVSIAEQEHFGVHYRRRAGIERLPRNPPDRHLIARAGKAIDVERAATVPRHIEVHAHVGCFRFNAQRDQPAGSNRNK
jgi:hypothetical protein